VPRKAKKAEESPVPAETAPVPEAAGPAEESPAAAEVVAADEGPITALDEESLEALEEPPANENLTQAVTFQLGGQLYGLPIEVVQEIQQLVEFSPMPDSAPALLGLIDLRGLVVPAIDLRVLVGLEPKPFTLQTPMVFCRVRDHVVCLVVDEVEDVIDLPSTGLQPPSGLYSLADKLLGMCRLTQGLVLLLDIDRLVPDAALAAADASAGGR